MDSDLELHLAIATYLATYADLANTSTRSYYASLDDGSEERELFLEFLR